MVRLKKLCSLLLTFALLCVLLPAPSAHAAAVPLRLAASYDAAEKLVTLDVVAAERVTLSNYDIQLDWDKAAFSLTRVTNGQSALIPNFMPNTDAANANYGKVSAMSGGSNVAIPQDGVLAIYTLSALGAPAPGSYSFTLTVKNVADENAAPLAWKGGTVTGSVAVPSEVALPLAFEAGYDAEAKTVTAIVTTTESITLANYDFLLDWDKAAFPLTGVTNGQNTLIPNFMANTNASSAIYGRVSAMSAGTNVTIPADSILATYSFSAANPPPDGTYSIVLTVKTAADEDGVPLAWRGASTSAAVSVGGQPRTRVTGVTLNKTALSLIEGGTETLTATVAPANATNRNVTWKSSNEDVAVVSMGTITAKAPGTASITAITEDGGKEASCTVSVTAKPSELSGIELSGKTEFESVEGVALDLSGLVVSAVYGNQKSVVTDYTVSGFDPNALGDQTVTVSYNGKNASLTVKVVAKSAQSISVETYPAKLNYQQGEALDLSGLSLRVFYNNGTQAVISSGWDSVAGYDKDAPGTQAVAVTYQGCTASFTVTVTAKTTGGDVAKPTLRLESVRGGKRVTLAAGDGATIYYTTDGSAPGESSALYSEPLLMTAKNTTLKAVAVKNGVRSNVTTATISVFQTGAPAPNPGAGTVAAGTIVTLRTDTVGATIYYTEDGTDPTADNAKLIQYNGAIIIDKTKTIKAIAIKDGYADSAVTGGFSDLTYTVPETPKPKDSVAITLGSVTVAAGDIASVPVYLFTDTEESTIKDFRISLGFDKNAFDNYVSITPADTIEPTSLYTSASGGVVNLLYQGDAIPGGEICTLNFTTLASMPSGTELSVEVNLGGSSITTNATGGTSLTTINATITLEAARVQQVSGTVTYSTVSGDETSVSKLASQPATQIEASMSIDETTTGALRETTANVYLVIYDRDLRMVDVETWKVDLSDPAFMFIHTINIPQNLEVGAIKIMVLSEQMTPLMAASELAK